MKAAERLLRAVENVFLYGSVISLLLMMVLVSADAVARYAFSRPLTFQFELTENYLMVAAILLPLAFVTRERQHIEIDTFKRYIPKPLLEAVTLFGLVAMVALLLVVTYVTGEKAYEAFRLNEKIFGVIDWPVGWSRVLVPLATGVFTVRLCMEIVRRATGGGDAGADKKGHA